MTAGSVPNTVQSTSIDASGSVAVAHDPMSPFPYTERNAPALDPRYRLYVEVRVASTWLRTLACADFCLLMMASAFLATSGGMALSAMALFSSRIDTIAGASGLAALTALNRSPGLLPSQAMIASATRPSAALPPPCAAAPGASPSVRTRRNPGARKSAGTRMIIAVFLQRLSLLRSRAPSRHRWRRLPGRREERT